jgi:hypothetical protein
VHRSSAAHFVCTLQLTSSLHLLYIFFTSSLHLLYIFCAPPRPCAGGDVCARQAGALAQHERGPLRGCHGAPHQLPGEATFGHTHTRGAGRWGCGGLLLLPRPISQRADVRDEVELRLAFPPSPGTRRGARRPPPRRCPLPPRWPRPGPLPATPLTAQTTSRLVGERGNAFVTQFSRYADLMIQVGRRKGCPRYQRELTASDCLPQRTACVEPGPQQRSSCLGLATHASKQALLGSVRECACPCACVFVRLCRCVASGRTRRGVPPVERAACSSPGPSRCVHGLVADYSPRKWSLTQAMIHKGAATA